MPGGASFPRRELGWCQGCRLAIRSDGTGRGRHAQVAQRDGLAAVLASQRASRLVIAAGVQDRHLGPIKPRFSGRPRTSASTPPGTGRGPSGSGGRTRATRCAPARRAPPTSAAERSIVGRQPETAPELVVAGQSMERVADDQQCPALAQDRERSSERAVLVRVVAAKWHGASLICQRRRLTLEER